MPQRQPQQDDAATLSKPFENYDPFPKAPGNLTLSHAFYGLRDGQPIPPPQAAPATSDEKFASQRYRALRDRIHEGPLYTILGDGVKVGEKRKADEPPPPPGALFDPFTGTQTYTAKYMKQRRKIPKLDTRPYVVHFFPAELRSMLDSAPKTNGAVNGDEPPSKKRKLLTISRATAMTKLERLEMEEEQRRAEAEQAELEEEEEEDDEDEDEEKEPEVIEDDDNLSVVSEDSEDADDDYNAEKYYDNGEDDFGGDDGGGHDDNYYD